MLSIFDNLRGFSFAAVLLRLFLVFLCGGLVGIEREMKRRPAGLRTHIMICLGAAITTLTSQYLYLEMGLYTDIARLGAQVVAGVGIICGGAIIVTRQKKIKGLTTAAGLWTVAVIGLCLGAGFYEGGILCTLCVLFVEYVLARWEFRMMNNSTELRLLAEYTRPTQLEQILRIFSHMYVSIKDMEVIPPGEGHRTSCVSFVLTLTGKYSANDILKAVRDIPEIGDVSEV